MIDWNLYPVGDHRVTCPACGRSGKDRTLGITILAGGHGIAHCFRCGMVESARDQREMPPSERQAYRERMDALRRDHEAEKIAGQLLAAQAARVRWEEAKPASDEHPYLRAKGVGAHGLRVDRAGALLAPVRDVAGRMCSIQRILPDGAKFFEPKGRTRGCFYTLAEPHEPVGRMVVCEGFATGATVREESGDAVAVAFNSGNLLPVARALRDAFPLLDLVIAADDDWQTEGNPGLTAAREAARLTGARLAVPDFTGLHRGPRDTDFNDLRRLAGMAEVHP